MVGKHKASHGTSAQCPCLPRRKGGLLSAGRWVGRLVNGRMSPAWHAAFVRDVVGSTLDLCIVERYTGPQLISKGAPEDIRRPPFQSPSCSDDLQNRRIQYLDAKNCHRCPLKPMHWLVLHDESLETRNKKPLGTKGIAIRSKHANCERNSWPYY